jgi:hypothetical protein
MLFQNIYHIFKEFIIYLYIVILAYIVVLLQQTKVGYRKEYIELLRCFSLH